MCCLLGKTNNNVICVKNWDLSNVPLQCLYKRAILTARSNVIYNFSGINKLEIL